MSASDPDSAVIAQSIEVPARFAVLFDRHAEAVFAYLARRVGRHPAEDLLGETFRIAFERRGAFRPDTANSRPWLFGIATNLVHRQRRQEMRHLAALDHLGARIPPPIDATLRSVERLDAQVELGPVLRALERLPGGDRDALLLYAWEDLTYAEVAEALGIPIGTVRSRINRARQQIADCVGRAPTPTTPGAQDDGE